MRPKQTRQQISNRPSTDPQQLTRMIRICIVVVVVTRAREDAANIVENFEKDRGGEVMSRSRKTDSILQALLANHTIREAAAAAQVTERTIYEYLRDPDFKADYQTARDDIIRGTANNLRNRMNEAVDVIATIMRDDAAPYRERRAAACAILEHGAKYTETLDILERMKTLEDKMSQNEE